MFHIKSPIPLIVTVLLLLGGCAGNATFLPAVPMSSAILDERRAATRLAFGSCFSTRQSGEIFGQVLDSEPDAFVFLGDNVYAEDESEDPALMSLREAYAELAIDPYFSRLREQTPVLVTWDDHDMGLDDAGGDWPHQKFSESLFEHVWDVGRFEDRARRPGIYYERLIGPPGQQLQIIMLDTRSFRTPLTRHPDQSVGRYTPSTDPNQSLLGEAQWQWLEEQLSKPADVRIIVSTIQVIAEGHHWEAWRMMPAERKRLYTLLKSTGASGVVVVSGDRHAASIYRLHAGLNYPLYELTTSSLNLPLSNWVPDPVEEPGPNRLGGVYFESNFGLVDVDWEKNEIALRIIDTKGRPVQERIVSLDSLQ